MSLPPKAVTCKCGHTLTLSQKKVWCDKCMAQVFYDPKDQRRAKYNTIYMWLLAFSIIFFISYVFLELIATPFLK